MKKLSVALAVFNEELNIRRCLKSVEHIADEIVVVDGGSIDKTVEFLAEFDAKVLKTTNPPVFHINKQKALDACTGEWILQLDADEEVSPALAKEIVEVINNSKPHTIDIRKKTLFDRHQQIIESRDHIHRTDTGPINAYYLPRRNYFLGKPMTYAGMYPDGVIRLFRNGKAEFPSKSVHEQLEVQGRVSWLEHDLYHYSNPTIHRYLLGADKYTSLVAKNLQHSNKNILSLFIQYCFAEPYKIFFSLYIRHKGMLDGFRGLLFSLFSSVQYPISFLKYVTKRY